ncbi:MAG: hypothetical protein ACOC0R_04045 [Mariniphaga sp.]
MKNIARMAAIATTGMTLFSYAISYVFKEKFLETMLLNQLVFPRHKETRKNHPAGFVIHFITGTFFSKLFDTLWKKTVLHPDFGTSFSFGFISGLVGITGWHIFFTLHPDPPKVKQKKFYAQLLAAHVVFGVLNGLVYKNHGIREE